MKKILLITISIVCIFLTPWLFLVPDWFAQNIGGCEEIYTFASVFTFFGAIILLSAARELSVSKEEKQAKMPCR